MKTLFGAVAGALALGAVLVAYDLGERHTFNRDAAAIYLIRIIENEKEVELRKSAISSLGRIAGEKSLGALTNTLDSDAETEIQKQAVIAIGRRPRDEAIPILIRTARSHPKMQVRKVAIQMLGQTGDERAVAFFRELLGK